MGNWSTRAAAIAELRTQLQDEDQPQRYTDAELGKGLDEALAELSALRPILTTVETILDTTLVVRLDNQIGLSTFGGIAWILEVTDSAAPAPVEGYYLYEQSGQHKVALPQKEAGDRLAIGVRGGYGFALSATVGGSSASADTNIPAEWREKVIQGAQGYVLELYGAREVGRRNVAPAMAQQTARAATVKLREFRQWIAALPFGGAGRQVVEWGLAAVDARRGDHRGFD